MFELKMDKDIRDEFKELIKRSLEKYVNFHDKNEKFLFSEYLTYIPKYGDYIMRYWRHDFSEAKVKRVVYNIEEDNFDIYLDYDSSENSDY